MEWQSKVETCKSDSPAHQIWVKSSFSKIILNPVQVFSFCLLLALLLTTLLLFVCLFVLPTHTLLEQSHGVHLSLDTWPDMATGCLSLESIQSWCTQAQQWIFVYWSLTMSTGFFLEYLLLIHSCPLTFGLSSSRSFILGESICYHFTLGLTLDHLPYPPSRPKLERNFPWTYSKINIDSRSGSGEIWQLPHYSVIQHWQILVMMMMMMMLIMMIIIAWKLGIVLLFTEFQIYFS